MSKNFIIFYIVLLTSISNIYAATSNRQVSNCLQSHAGKCNANGPRPNMIICSNSPRYVMCCPPQEGGQEDCPSYTPRV